MNSGRSTGINPYNRPAVIINIFIIDNFFFELWSAAARAEALAWQDAAF